METIRFELVIDGECKQWNITGEDTLHALVKAMYKIPNILEFEYMQEALRTYKSPKFSGVVYDIMSKEQK